VQTVSIWITCDGQVQKTFEEWTKTGAGERLEKKKATYTPKCFACKDGSSDIKDLRKNCLSYKRVRGSNRKDPLGRKNMGKIGDFLPRTRRRGLPKRKKGLVVDDGILTWDGFRRKAKSLSPTAAGKKVYSVGLKFAV